MSNILTVADGTTRADQLAIIQKYLDLEIANSAKLELASQNYYRDNIQPLNMTSNKTTSEILGDLVGLQHMIKTDIGGMLKDPEQLWEFMRFPDYNDVSFCQKLVQNLPGIQESIPKGRFLTAKLLMFYIQQYLKKIDATAGVSLPWQAGTPGNVNITNSVFNPVPITPAPPNADQQSDLATIAPIAPQLNQTYPSFYR